MMRLGLAFAFAATSASLAAQVSPVPSFDDPRLQTVSYQPSQTVRLVAFPGANLTVMLLPGDAIERATVSDRNAFDVRIANTHDSLNIMPLRTDALATLFVETAQRRYQFELDTGEGLAAAYVVRFVQPRTPEGPPQALAAAEPPEITGQYKLSGANVLRPTRIGDDGERTYIEWGEYQPLPAVFGIGPTGQEEAVDGYMRSGVFTIDRVYSELVFRIDKERAKARRLRESDG